MVFMIQIPSTKFVFLDRKIIKSVRNISRYLNRDVCSKAIREKFLDFFVNENNHKFIKSSPVIPLCDPSIAFVNAGMNQFKSFFLGLQTPTHQKVANSQKCIRMGGKHNDISVVGEDGYHHTFFEMLGNWSFGNYFKVEACQMAWELLTNVYKLPKNRLYVTYFKGDQTLNLQGDLETKEIWKKIGIPDSRILPFGLQDNFWEMGLTGPCGPCTEIHFDHLGTNNRREFVNKGLHDLIELWNIVFIQYNRLPNGEIKNLPQKHVDTGMGFERLTSVLQGKMSNYDTDNFNYLFKAISKNCSNIPQYEGKFGENDWNNMDKSYRTLADHSRAITICLADGVIPEENQKLRRVMRKAFLLSENIFKKPKGLVRELSNYIAENLGIVYPELEKNIAQVHKIVDYEEEVYKAAQESTAKNWKILISENPRLLDYDIVETPSFIAAYKELSTLKVEELDSKMAFKLYDTFGLDEDSITSLANALCIRFDSDLLSLELENARMRSKQGAIRLDDKLYHNILNENIPKTEDSYKYSYKKENNQYIFNDLNVEILKIYDKENSTEEVFSEHYCALLLDKTNLYSEAGGQVGDKGLIIFENGVFNIESVENVNGYILHKGFFKSEKKTLRVHTTGTLKLNQEFRSNCMRNHTATHLLNACLKKIKGVTCQKSSKVTDQNLSFDVAVFGDKLKPDEIMAIDDEIRRIIDLDIQVKIKEVDYADLLNFDFVTYIPGETYPETGIRIVEVQTDNLISREPCCGTHLLTTGDLIEFCITGIKSLGRSTVSITAVTGEKAKLARLNGTELIDEVASLEIFVKDNIDKPELLNMAIAALKKKLGHCIEKETVPILIKNECFTKLDVISNEIRDRMKEKLRDFIEIEMKNAIDSKVKTTKSNHKFIVHYLRASTMLENAPLQKATKICPDLPVLVIAYTDNAVKARCCVPEILKSSKFNAEKWMKETVADVFKSKVSPPKGQDGTLVCNMKAKKVPIQELDQMLQLSLSKAENFADENL